MANLDKRPNPVPVKEAEVVKQPEPVKGPVTEGATGSPVTPTQANQAVPEVTVSEVVSLPAINEEKLVSVVPRETIPTTRIGNEYYSFLKGVATKVPLSVKQLLQEKGVL